MMIRFETTTTLQSAILPTGSDGVDAHELPQGDTCGKNGNTCGRNDMICDQKHAMFLKG
jgi:hypothetical protein